MKTKLLFAAALCLNFTLKAQTTYVPDDNFEQHLINIGLDSGPLDDYVLTENIDTVTHLDFGYYAYSLENVIGIEDFVLLEYLKMNESQITSLDLTQSPNLTYIECNANQQLIEFNITQNLRLKHLDLAMSGLTTIDLSHNDSLKHIGLFNSVYIDTVNTSNNLQLETLFCNHMHTYLDVTNNQELKHISFSGTIDYPTLDLSQNLKLETVYSPCGQLQTLDLSHNTMLTAVNIYCNELTYLNLQNGNNSNILDADFKINSNPFLTCVLVDDEEFSSQNWFQLDAQTFYSTSCVTGTQESEDIVLSISPNPMKDFVNISVNEPAKYFVLSSDGKQVKSGSLYSGKNYINTDELNNGVYFINVNTNGKSETFKIIRQ
jgi:hypothetical protein